MNLWKKWIVRALLTLFLTGVYLLSVQILDYYKSEFSKPVTVTFSLPFLPEISEKYSIDPFAAVKEVYVTGNFANWSSKNPVYKMIEREPQKWSLPLNLLPGDNHYKFVVVLEDGGESVWTQDPNASKQVDDSYEGFNSVYHVPDIDQWRFVVSSILLGLLAVVILYSVTDPLIRWILLWKIPVRFKLVGALFVTVIFSNTVFLLYNQRELREMTKIGLQDNLNVLHNALLADQVNFENLQNPEEINRIQTSLRNNFYRAGTRIERLQTGNSSVTLSDVGILSPSLELLILMPRRDNDQLQTGRAAKAGFKTLNEYFEKGILAPLIEEARDKPYQRTLFTGMIQEDLLKEQTADTASSIKNLGYNTFLLPIVVKGQIVGYYAGDVQTKMLSGEVNRILYFNLYLVALVALLSTLLYTNLGKALTSHLTKLTQWTESIKSGQYDEVHVVKTGDEMQKLSENFDHMRLSLQNSMEKLLIEAYRDTLTQMPNRKKLLQDLESSRDRALILLNIDSFQEINDYFSSEFGDFVLIETAHRLDELTQGTPLQIYKIGSDEYVLLLDGNRPKEDLETLAQSVCDTIVQKSYANNNNEVYISLSAGMAQFSVESSIGREYRPSLLLAEADMALKKAKHSPRRLIHYDRSMEIDREYGQNFLWTSKIRQALAGDRIVPYFQPIVNNLTQQVEKYECLVRMIDIDGTVISPASFLQISKKSRFYRFITMAMVEKSLEIFENSNFEFSINLGIEDILDEKTQEYLFDQMARFPQATKRLVFEVVETDSLDNYTDIRSFIKKVRPMGCKIAIDDFGSGYSNFEHLLQLEVDYLKIDASLIKTMDVDLNAQIITGAISHFAQDLGIKTVAEYVHSKAVYDKVCELKLDFSQGYYWGQPQAHIAK